MPMPAVAAVRGYGMSTELVHGRHWHQPCHQQQQKQQHQHQQQHHQQQQHQHQHQQQQQ